LGVLYLLRGRNEEFNVLLRQEGKRGTIFSEEGESCDEESIYEEGKEKVSFQQLFGKKGKEEFSPRIIRGEKNSTFLTTFKK